MKNMENNHEMQLECIRSREVLCPLSDEDMHRLVKRSIDAVRVHRWGWVPYTVSFFFTAAVLSTSLALFKHDLGGTLFAFNTHGMTPSSAIEISNALLAAV